MNLEHKIPELQSAKVSDPNRIFYLQITKVYEKVLNYQVLYINY